MIGKRPEETISELDPHPVPRPKISELPPCLAEKIAAGEVVNRPLSVVKELAENSIDAGATSIEIEIKGGGKTFIRVTDNGCGIPAEQVEVAFRRHATSKLKSLEDLDHIMTLGFRGEALTSIAAVSRLELMTKTREEKTGTRVAIEGGLLLEKKEIGTSDGTTMIVRDLFYNTPARLKFMKPDRTESSLIIDMVSKLALAWPSIRFRLINNGNILFSTPGRGDLMTNVLTIYGRDVADGLLTVEESDSDIPGLSIFGLVSSPNKSRTNRKGQIFFINGRIVSSRILDRAVAEAYYEMMFEGRYPVAVLFISVPPAGLDVNIHPAKSEVRFADELVLQRFVSESIRKTIRSRDAMPVPDKQKAFTAPPAASETPSAVVEAPIAGPYLEPDNKPGVTQIDQVDIKQLLSIKRVMEEAAQHYDARLDLRRERCTEMEPADPSEIPSSENLQLEPAGSMADRSRPFDIGKIRSLGSVFATYIIGMDDDSVYFIDQHAAHERIFYEQLLVQYRSREKLTQQLLTPLIRGIPPFLFSAQDAVLALLLETGFDAESFGPRTLAIRAIPAFLDVGEAERFLDYLLDNAGEDFQAENREVIEKIIMDSCKKAVKANDLLKDEEIRALLSDLSRCENPYSCPHGRPVFVRMRKYDIEKMFKRV